MINNEIKAEDVPNYLHNDRNKYAKIVVDIEFEDREKELLKKFFECYISMANISLKPDKICIDIFVEILSKGKIVWEYNGEFGGYIQPVYYATPNIELNNEINKILNLVNDYKNRLIERIGGEDKIKSLKNLYILKKLGGGVKNNIDIDKDDDVIDNIKELESITDFLLGKKRLFIKVAPDKIERYVSEKKETLMLMSAELFLNADINSFERILKELQNYDEELSIPPYISILYHYTESPASCNLEIDKHRIKNDRKFDAKTLFEFSGLNFDNSDILNFHKLIIKLFDKAIIKFEEVRGYPEKEKYNKIHTNELEKRDYDGNGKDLAKYLFYLKFAHEIDIRNKYDEIRNSFIDIFKTENINFDVVINREGNLEVVITFEDKQLQLPINRVGSGIFEVLNILAVVIGNKNKVILLDEPALHLHPVYQKRLLEEFKKLNENGDNQVIIITHSPYFVYSKLLELENTFRFYKENGKTKAINVGKLTKDKTLKDFIRNDGLIHSLFANGVILVEGDLEYISVPILLKKVNCALEDHNIEIINVRSKTGFEKYVKLMNALRISCAVICDGDTAYNLYNKIKNDKVKKWELKNNLPCIIEVYNNIKPFWIKDIGKILNDVKKKIEGKKSSLKKYLDVDEPLEEELVKYGIEPIYNEIKDELRNKLLIFACKEYDWSGFLGSNDKDIENCMKKTYEFNDDKKLNDLKQFIQNFINRCIRL